MLAGCAASRPRPIAAAGHAQSAAMQVGDSGPTIQLRGPVGEAPTNSISALMYFVKLISPEPVVLSVNEGNSQLCRILAIDRQMTSSTFTARCPFEITGDGIQQSVFDQTPSIRRNQEALLRGDLVKRQLRFIKIKGSGQGEILVEGLMSGDQAIVHRISMHFGGRAGSRILVTIGINDICHRDGKPFAVNDQVIKVDSLDFRRQGSDPKMYVTLNSIKSAAAGDGLMSNLIGRVKGAVANIIIPPVPIRMDGNEAMLGFAQAIVDGKRSFTFPLAQGT